MLFQDLLPVQGRLPVDAHITITHRHPCRCVVHRRKTCLEFFLTAFFSQEFEQVSGIICSSSACFCCSSRTSISLFFRFCCSFHGPASGHLLYYCHVRPDLLIGALSSEHAFLTHAQLIPPSNSPLQHQYPIVPALSSPDASVLCSSCFFSLLICPSKLRQRHHYPCVPVTLLLLTSVSVRARCASADHFIKTTPVRHPRWLSSLLMSTFNTASPCAV